MGKLFDELDPRLRAFLAAQRVFFVASAPAGKSGHVNLSPKGVETLRVLGPRSVGYLDFVGSGAETIAHLRENGRIVIMLCAFEGAPRIVRLHGRGRTVEPPDAEWTALRSLFPPEHRARAIVLVELERISDSCGYGVPLYRYEGERTHMADWASRKGDAGLDAYQREKNAASIDGLPALRWTEGSLRVRPYRDADLDETVDVWSDSKHTAFSYVPLHQSYTRAQDKEFFGGQLVPTCAIWLAEQDGRIAGLLALRGDVVEQLFVRTDLWRQGVGERLLRHAMHLRPRGLRLFTFQKNEQARRFYEKHGFRAERFGRSPPPEDEPDVEYVWGDPAVSSKPDAVAE